MKTLKFVYFKQSGKYYAAGELEIDPKSSIFSDCIYPRDYGKRCQELNMLPGLQSGTWSGPFTVDSDYPELMISEK